MHSLKIDAVQIRAVSVSEIVRKALTHARCPIVGLRLRTALNKQSLSLSTITESSRHCNQIAYSGGCAEKSAEPANAIIKGSFANY